MVRDSDGNATVAPSLSLPPPQPPVRAAAAEAPQAALPPLALPHQVLRSLASFLKAALGFEEQQRCNVETSTGGLGTALEDSRQFGEHDEAAGFSECAGIGGWATMRRFAMPWGGGSGCGCCACLSSAQ